jgi:hypothetical protein
MTTQEQIVKRLEVLEDIEAIKKVKARYGQLVDQRYSGGVVKGRKELEAIANEVVKLATEDAVWALGKTCKGRKEIFEHLIEPRHNFGVHYFLTPDITVNGTVANGHWLYWMPATTRDKDNKAIWVAGFYDEEYIKVDGQWLIKDLKLTIVKRGEFFGHQ